MLSGFTFEVNQRNGSLLESFEAPPHRIRQTGLGIPIELKLSQLLSGIGIMKIP